MKYRNSIGLAVLGAVLLGCVVVFARRAESAGVVNARLAPKWEYGYVLNSRTQLKTAFVSPTESVTAPNAFDLYQKLGGRKREAEFTLADLLSHVGAQGWELVSFETQDAVSSTYWFKRVAQ